MAPFMTLIFLLVMAMIGFVFDLYLYSRGAFGDRHVRNTKFTSPVSTGSFMNNTDDYEFCAYGDKMYDRSQRAHTVLVVMCAVVVILVLFLFMVINSIL